MAFVSLANFVVFSLLLCSSTAVYGDETLFLHRAPAEAPHPSPSHHHHHPSSPPPPSLSPPPPPPPSHPPPPPPYHPPATPPAHPPVKPPSYPPVKPPSYPSLRKKVAVQGVVYCKSCKYRGFDKVLGLRASPLPGASVKLQCNNTNYGWEDEAKTDKNGYFLLKPKKLTTSGVHKCKVFLVSSPLPKCGVRTNFRGGVTGAALIPNPSNKKLPYQFFTVGPFAFEAPKKLPCHY